MPIIEIAILAIVTVLVFIFYIRRKVTTVLVVGVYTAFPTIAIVVICAVLFPILFTTMSDWGLKTLGTYDAIKSIDNQTSTLTGGAGGIWDGINNFLTGQGQKEGNEDSKKGYIESNYYQSLVESVAFVLRILTIVFGIVSMIVLIYLGIMGSTLADTVNMQSQIQTLERRLEQLESQIAT